MISRNIDECIEDFKRIQLVTNLYPFRQM